MQAPTKNGDPRPTKPPRRKRTVLQLSTQGRRETCISAEEHNDLARRRLQRFMDEASGGRVAPLQLTQDMDLEQAFARCRDCMAASKRARPHEPVVWVVSRMNLLTLALCQDMGLPLFMGGEGQGPRDDTGDCVWLYNWAPGRFFCGNPECGQLIVTSLRHFYCSGCQQVQYCPRPECALKGGALHQPKCSGSPNVPSCSYFMEKFLVSDIKEATIEPLEPADEQLLSVEEYMGRCFDAEDFGLSAEDLEMLDGGGDGNSSDLDWGQDEPGPSLPLFF